MKKAFVLVSLFLFACNCYSITSPNAGEIYRVKINLTDNFHDFNTATSTCGATTFDAEQNTLISVVSVLPGANMVVVQVVRAFKGVHQVTVNATYCISQSDLSLWCELYDPSDSGILSIPFKLRFAPTTFSTGGTIGYYVGHKFEGRASSTTLLGFAGLGLISLNDISSKTPDSKLGLTIGGGYVWKPSTDKDFQVGIITGVDIFEGADQWVYKYWPWVSLSVGFTFTKRTVSTAQAVNLQ